MNTAGNSCPGDGVTDCTLGVIDACVQLPTGGAVATIDVFLKDLPPGAELAGICEFAYHIGERSGQAIGTLTGTTHSNPSVNLVVQEPLPQPADLSDPLPAPLPGWDAWFIDFAWPEYNPPFTKGVLSRLEIDTSGRPDGIYALTIDPLDVLDYVMVSNDGAENYCEYVGCNILDAHNGYGLIAIGQACPAPPAGGMAELPDVAGSDSPTPNHLALAGLAALALLGLTVGGWYARRRWLG
jgi:hypothetical protein